jgi:drug/metabolite transporter (DMT)-like permease
MIDLALSVLFTSLLYVIFKFFARFEVQTLYAIITNYFTAALVGAFFLEDGLRLQDAPQKPWFLGTFVLGMFFIIIFNVMAKSSQELGVSLTAVAAKMALVIPVVFGMLFFKDTLSIWQGIGVLLALVAVYFASLKSTDSANPKNALWLLGLVFIGSGLIDVALNYFQEQYVLPAEVPLFTSTVFAAAGITGILLIVLRSFQKPLKINLKNMLWGVILGVPNYFSIHFLLAALRNENGNSASVFTINNVAIVLFSTLLGILIFKEKLSMKNWGGIVIAVISIALVALF